MKNLSNTLNQIYPNSKVYVISDHHFGHKNIINYGRGQFETVDAMNEHIFNMHNSIITDDDVVIFLGDVAFTSSAKNIVKNMKGHKFLIVGNHDENISINNFREYGFENMYVGVVKLGDDIYLSHYPLDEVLLKDDPDIDMDTRLNLISALKEFNNNKNAINYFGHLHLYNPTNEKFVNCSCEKLNFIPYFLCLLKSYENDIDCNSLKFISSVTEISKSINCNVEEILTDYIFSQVLKNISDSNTFLYGSYSLYKTTGIRFKWSDLDISVIPSLCRSLRYNKSVFKNEFTALEKLFDNLNNYNYLIKKKYDNCRIMDVYSTFSSNKNIKTYIDMNLLSFPIYSESDFISVNTNSIYENELNTGIDKTITSYVKCLKPEIVFLSYIYKFLCTENIDVIKRIKLLERDKRIYTGIENVDEVENMLAKILLFNVMFLCVMYEKKNLVDCFAAFDKLEKLPHSIRYIFDSAYNNSGLLKDTIEFLKSNLGSEALSLSKQREKIEEIGKVLKK